jgi:hypothetical protein
MNKEMKKHRRKGYEESEGGDKKKLFSKYREQVISRFEEALFSRSHGNKKMRGKE